MNNADLEYPKMLQFILAREGGYVNDKDDMGGETNRGITHTTYNSYRRSKGMQTQSVKYITQQEVEDIYYNNYYKASGADKIENPRLALYEIDRKRKILKLVFPNFWLDGRNLSYELKKPFNEFIEKANCLLNWSLAYSLKLANRQLVM